MPYSSKQVLGKGPGKINLFSSGKTVPRKMKQEKVDPTSDKIKGQWFSSTLCGPFQVVCRLKNYFIVTLKWHLSFLVYRCVGVDTYTDGANVIMTNTSDSLEQIKAVAPKYIRSHGFHHYTMYSRWGWGQFT